MSALAPPDDDGAARKPPRRQSFARSPRGAGKAVAALTTLALVVAGCGSSSSSAEFERLELKRREGREHQSQPLTVASSRASPARWPPSGPRTSPAAWRPSRSSTTPVVCSGTSFAARRSTTPVTCRRGACRQPDADQHSNLVALVGPGASRRPWCLSSPPRISRCLDRRQPAIRLEHRPVVLPSRAVGQRDRRVMGYWASTHFANAPAASVFTSVSAQTVPAPLASEYEKLGGHIVKSVILAPGQSSYRTEAEQVLAAHPKLIFTETDPQTAATFFSELLQLSGSLPPVVGDEADTYSPWVKAVLPVVAHKLNLVAVTQTTPGSSPGYVQFKNALLASGAQVKNPSQYATGPFTIADYDAVIIAALAMNAAHSTDPVKYRPYITSVTGLVSAGNTVIHTYAQGVAALKSGKTIRYSGAGGLISFNAHHNAATPFGALKLNNATGSFTSAGTIPLKTLLSIQ